MCVLANLEWLVIDQSRAALEGWPCHPCVTLRRCRTLLLLLLFPQRRLYFLNFCICLFVRRITQKVMDEFRIIFGGVNAWLATADYTLMTEKDKKILNPTLTPHGREGMSRSRHQATWRPPSSVQSGVTSRQAEAYSQSELISRRVYKETWTAWPPQCDRLCRCFSIWLCRTASRKQLLNRFERMAHSGAACVFWTRTLNNCVN